MRKLARSMMLLSVLVLLTGPVAAQQEDETTQPAAEQTVGSREWQFRFGLVLADTDNVTTVEIEPGTVDAHVFGGAGISLSLERRVLPFLGLEFGMMGIGADMSVSSGTDFKYFGTETEMLGMGVFSFGANYHFVKEGRVDVYAGPFLAYNRYKKMTVHSWTDGDWWPWHGGGEWSSVVVKSDSELSWGAKAGLDIVLGKKKRWTVGCVLGFIDATYDMEPEGGTEAVAVDLDPLILSLGAGFRF